jgi:hypothetical protein
MFNFLLLDRGKEEGIIRNMVRRIGRHGWVGGVEKTGQVREGETLRPRNETSIVSLLGRATHEDTR